MNEFEEKIDMNQCDGPKFRCPFMECDYRSRDAKSFDIDHDCKATHEANKDKLEWKDDRAILKMPCLIVGCMCASIPVFFCRGNSYYLYIQYIMFHLGLLGKDSKQNCKFKDLQSYLNATALSNIGKDILKRITHWYVQKLLRLEQMSSAPVIPREVGRRCLQRLQSKNVYYKYYGPELRCPFVGCDYVFDCSCDAKDFCFNHNCKGTYEENRRMLTIKFCPKMKRNKLIVRMQCLIKGCQCEEPRRVFFIKPTKKRTKTGKKDTKKSKKSKIGKKINVEDSKENITYSYRISVSEHIRHLGGHKRNGHKRSCIFINERSYNALVDPLIGSELHKKIIHGYILRLLQLDAKSTAPLVPIEVRLECGEKLKCSASELQLQPQFQASSSFLRPVSPIQETVQVVLTARIVRQAQALLVQPYYVRSSVALLPPVAPTPAIIQKRQEVSSAEHRQQHPSMQGTHYLAIPRQIQHSQYYSLGQALPHTQETMAVSPIVRIQQPNRPIKTILPTRLSQYHSTSLFQKGQRQPPPIETYVNVHSRRHHSLELSNISSIPKAPIQPSATGLVVPREEKTSPRLPSSDRLPSRGVSSMSTRVKPQSNSSTAEFICGYSKPMKNDAFLSPPSVKEIPFVLREAPGQSDISNDLPKQGALAREENIDTSLFLFQEPIPRLGEVKLSELPTQVPSSRQKRKSIEDESDTFDAWIFPDEFGKKPKTRCIVSSPVNRRSLHSIKSSIKRRLFMREKDLVIEEDTGKEEAIVKEFIKREILRSSLVVPEDTT